MDRAGFIKECPYPDEILQGRAEIEANVIGCLFQDPLLLDDTPILTTEKFMTKRCRSFFELCQRIRSKGFSTFDAQGVYSVMNKKTVEKFEEMGGMDKIREYMKGVNISNWDIYLDDLIRENTICYLYDMNVDCTLPQTWNGEEIIPLNIFRKQRNEDLIAFWDAKLAGIPTSTSSKIIEKGIVDFDDEWIQSLQEGTENGDPFEASFTGKDGRRIPCYPMLSKNVSGLLPGTTTMLGAYSSVGKSTWWVSVLMSMLSIGKKVLVISNEEPMSKIKQKIFVWIAENVFGYDMSKKRLIAGHFNDEDKKVLEQVKKFWQQNKLSENFFYIFLNDPDIGLISKNIREFALKEGVDVVLYDTFKIQGDDMKMQRQDLALVRDSRTLDSLAKKYGLIMLCSVQLAEHMKGKLWLDSSCLSNSKQIKEQLENLFLIRNCYEEEIDPSSKYYIRPLWRVRNENGIWETTEIQLDSSKTYKVLFIEKSRGGANSSDTNRAILLDFDGDHSTFREVGYCRPRHGSIT